MTVADATTDSPWPVSNNPEAKYDSRDRTDSNLDWQLVRASTAAPTCFPPEYVKLGSRDFMFVDGGVMLLVSIGTGASLTANAMQTGAPNLIDNARNIPSALMNAAAVQQDLAGTVNPRLDAVGNIANLQKIGRALAAAKVKPSLFDGFV